MTERTIEQSREACEKAGLAEGRHIISAQLTRQNEPVDLGEDAIGGAGIGEHQDERPAPVDPLGSGCGFIPGEGI